MSHDSKKMGKKLDGVKYGTSFTKWGKNIEISLNEVICGTKVVVGGKKWNLL